MTEVEFRKALWLAHGCPVSALYGDDGELQCNCCMIDFKRNTFAVIFEKVRSIAEAKTISEIGSIIINTLSREEAKELIKTIKTRL